MSRRNTLAIAFTCLVAVALIAAGAAFPSETLSFLSPPAGLLLRLFGY